MVIRLVILVWLVAAVAAGATGLLRFLPVPPPFIALALSFALLLLVRLSPGVRRAVHALGPGPLVGFHATRVAAGAYFLVMGARGVLPREFTTFAGWGDIVVGVAAVWIVLRCLPVTTTGRRVALLAWNVAGLIDILGVLANGLRLFLPNPAVAEPFMSLPLALLPTFVVPIVIVSHVMLFGFLRAERARQPRAGAPRGPAGT